MSSPQKIYHIKDWEKVFEVSDSKKVDGPLKWVPVRTSTDGFGYARITLERNRCELLAAWYLIVALAARQNKADRGKLMRDGRPLTPEDMEVMTRFPAQVFEKAIAYFSDPKIGWLIADGESEPVRTNPDASEPIPSTGQDRTIQDNKKSTPAIADVEAVPDSLNGIEFLQAWADWKRHRAEIRHPLKPTSAQQTLAALEKIGQRRAIAMIRFTIFKGWRGLREPSADDLKQFQAGGSNQPDTEPEGWRAYWRETYPPEDYPDAPRYDEGDWASVRDDHKKQIREAMRRRNR